MRKKFLVGLILSIFLVTGGFVVAQKVEKIPAVVAPSGQIVQVPATAIDNSPALERVIFIHYKNDTAFVKPSSPGRKAPSCYGFLSRNTKWQNLPVNFVISPELESAVPGAILQSAQNWDNSTLANLFSDSFLTDSTATWDGSLPDGRNEMVFGNYSEDGVIAITVAWGYFSGPASARKIVEADILFDTDFAWGDANVNPAVMDLENIATHEIGHAIGLADVYEASCNEATMYGYADYGQTNKTTLELPDITGLHTLYGN
jgi:hypothetical protein